MALTGAILAGTSIVLAKCGGEILQGDEAADYGLLGIFFYVGCGLIGGLQAYFINLSMKYYNQIDVMPIYQSFLLIFMIVSGLIFLDESANYTWGELIRLFASSGFVILGIYVLTRKQSAII